MKSVRFIALLALLCVTTSVFAQHVAKGKAKNDDNAPPTPSTATNSADAQANSLRQPTNDEARELAAGLEKALSQPTEGLRQIDMGNGMVGVDLDGTYQSVALAKIAPDGTVAVGCVSSVAEGREFLAADASTQKPAAPAAKAPAGKQQLKADRSAAPAAPPLEEK